MFSRTLHTAFLRGSTLLGLAWLTGCHPTFNWRDTPIAPGVKAQFPCSPDKAVRQVEVPGFAAKQTLTLLSCDTGSATWAILSTPPATTHAQANQTEQWLRVLHEAALRNVTPTTTGSTSTAPNTPPAPTLAASQAGPFAEQSIQVSGQRPDGSAVELYARVFALNGQVFQASVLTPPTADAPLVEAIDEFFAGLPFKTTKNRP